MRGARRAVGVVTLAAALTGALGGGSGAPASAGPGEELTPPTTEPAPGPTVPTVPATTPSEPTPTTSTTTPTVPTIPGSPAGEHSGLNPEQTVVAPAEYATLTDVQRALLRQLQQTRDALALRRFALVGLAREVGLARDSLEATRRAERAARTRVEETRVELGRVKDEFVRLAVAAYRQQKDAWVLGSLGSVDTANASTLLRAQTYARADTAVLGERLDAVRTLQRRLETDRRTAEAARAAAEQSATDLDARLAEQTAAYDEARDASDRAQAAVARSLGSDPRLAAQVLDPRFGTDSIMSLLAFVQAGQGVPTTLDGILAMPVPGASLSSPFGIRIDPIEGTVAFHAGLDFAAPARTPIFAPAAGVVVVAGDCGGYGNCVVIDHGDSLATLLGHMSEVHVQVGELVPVSHAIGLVGSTGRSTGPHLHLEVRLQGTPIDPLPTLAG